MEASGTFEGDTEEAKEMQESEDRLDDAETIGKARGIYREIEELDKELDMHKDRAKDCQKRIDGKLDRIRVLICEPNQMQIPMGPAPEEHPCTAPEGHTWERIREGEMILEDCVICPMERTAKVLPDQAGSDEPTHEPWVYTTPEVAAK